MFAKKIGAGFIFGLLLLSGNTFAQVSTDYNSPPPQGQQQNGASRVPPGSAISACSGKSEGTACVVTGPNGTKQGVCAYTPDKKYYACKPNDMKMSGPPPQQ